eukprot:408666_1
MGSSIIIPTPVTGTPSCHHCDLLKKNNRILREQLINAREKLVNGETQLKALQKQNEILKQTITIYEQNKEYTAKNNDLLVQCDATPHDEHIAISPTPSSNGLIAESDHSDDNEEPHIIKKSTSKIRSYYISLDANDDILSDHSVSSHNTAQIEAESQVVEDQDTCVAPDVVIESSPNRDKDTCDDLMVSKEDIDDDDTDKPCSADVYDNTNQIESDVDECVDDSVMDNDDEGTNYCFLTSDDEDDDIDNGSVCSSVQSDVDIARAVLIKGVLTCDTENEDYMQSIVDNRAIVPMAKRWSSMPYCYCYRGHNMCDLCLWKYKLITHQH